MSMGGAIPGARMRVTIAFAAVACGYLLSSRFAWPSVGCFAVCAAALAVVAGLRGIAARCALVVATGALAAGWYAVQLNEPGAGSLARVVPGAGEERPAVLTVRGTVLTGPRVVERPTEGLAKFVVSGQRTRFDLAADSVLMESGEWRAASGNVWVRVEGEEPPAIVAGEYVELTGLFSAPGAPTNPGESDMRLAAAQTGFVGLLSLSAPDLIRPVVAPHSVGWSAWSGFLRARAWLQARARAVVDRAAGDGDATTRSFLRGLMLGDYDPSRRDVYDAFARQGLVHVLSISGFHLSAMALVALALVRLSGDRGWIEPVVVAGLVVVYMVIVPPNSPVIRSGAMVLVLLLADAMGRRYDHVTLLGWIAIGLLVWRPRDLWSMGYQLSVGLTAALFWLTPIVKGRLFGEVLRGTVKFREHRLRLRLIGGVQEGVSANLLCWGLATPLIAYRVGIVSPFAFVVSFLVTPIVVVVLWIGYVALLVGMFIPAAAGAASGLLSLLARAATGLVTLADSVPMSAVYVPPVSLVWVFGATIGIGLFLRLSVRRGPVPAPAMAGLGVLLAIWSGIELLVPRKLPTGVALRVDTLDVGNGTCHLIRSGTEAVLWDCGSLSNSGIQSRIVASVRALGVHRTPRVVITHPDIDHFGAILDLARPLGVQEVITCGRFVEDAARTPRGSAAAMLEGLAGMGIVVRTVAAGEEMAVGERVVRFVSPPRDAVFETDNDHSLVATIGDGNEIPLVLMTGDIQDAAIASLRERHPGLRAVALELPHHGSARAPAIEWVGLVDPAIVMQSTGARRANDVRWGHLREGRRWLCTAVDGASFVEFGADGARSGSRLGGAGE